MTDLSRLADMAEIFAALVVVGGLLFALIQMRQTRQQRRELAAIEVFRSFGQPQFAEAFRCIIELPDGLTHEELVNAYPKAKDHAMLVAITMENIGVMTFQRIVPFAVVHHLAGNSAELLWRKLSNWTLAMREQFDDPTTFEWFQWLSDRLQEHDHPGVAPAYENHRDWTPARLTPEI